MPKKYFLILAVGLAAIGGLVFWSFQSDKAGAPTSEIVYYYGKDCPHCQNVEKFVEDNNIASRVKFSKKEVQYDLANGREFLERVKECGLDAKKAGVPFVYSQGRCYVGEPEVTDFFKKSAGPE